MRQSPCCEMSTSSFLEETDKSISHLNSVGEMQRESLQTSETARMSDMFPVGRGVWWLAQREGGVSTGRKKKSKVAGWSTIGEGNPAKELEAR